MGWRSIFSWHSGRVGIGSSSPLFSFALISFCLILLFLTGEQLKRKPGSRPLSAFDSRLQSSKQNAVWLEERQGPPHTHTQRMANVRMGLCEQRTWNMSSLWLTCVSSGIKKHDKSVKTYNSLQTPVFHLLNFSLWIYTMSAFVAVCLKISMFGEHQHNEDMIQPLKLDRFRRTPPPHTHTRGSPESAACGWTDGAVPACGPAELKKMCLKNHWGPVGQFQIQSSHLPTAAYLNQVSSAPRSWKTSWTVALEILRSWGVSESFHEEQRSVMQSWTGRSVRRWSEESEASVFP